MFRQVSKLCRPSQYATLVTRSFFTTPALFDSRSKGKINYIFHFVPQQTNYVIERFGRYNRTAKPGFTIVLPFIEKIAYVQNLKQQIIKVQPQSGITEDNVRVKMDAVLYYEIKDAAKASYAVENIDDAVVYLAQSAMRNAIGKYKLDDLFVSRKMLNDEVLSILKDAIKDWGIEVPLYEIQDIIVPTDIEVAMHRQASAERMRREVVKEAQAKKESHELESSGVKARQINEASGKAQAIKMLAEAQAEAIERVAAAIQKVGGKEAVSMEIAKEWLKSWSSIAKETNTVIVPRDMGDVSSMVTTALSVFQKINQNQTSNSTPSKDT